MLTIVRAARERDRIADSVNAVSSVCPSAAADCSVDADTLARLTPALAVLDTALDRYQADGVVAGLGLTVVCATPDGASLIQTTACADEVVDEVDQDIVLSTLFDAIESDKAPEAISALSAILGSEGRADVERETAAIRQRGGQPLLIVLAALGGGSIRALVGTVTMPHSVKSSATLH